MKVWRKALTEVRSAAQLAMCIQQLQKSIAWERSIMKVVSGWCEENDNRRQQASVLTLAPPLSTSTVKCARRATTRIFCCCATAATKAATLTVTNPRSPVSQRETGTAQPAYPRLVTS